MINEHSSLPTVPTQTLVHTRTQTQRWSPKGSLVSTSCDNSVGQVIEQGVMMHQQHQPWVAPPAAIADGTYNWKAAIN